MRIAIFYFVMGILFAYLAYTSVTDTVWNLATILLTIVAALDFGIGFRYMNMHFKAKKNES